MKNTINIQQPQQPQQPQKVVMDTDVYMFYCEQNSKINLV